MKKLIIGAVLAASILTTGAFANNFNDIYTEEFLPNLIEVDQDYCNRISYGTLQHIKAGLEGSAEALEMRYGKISTSFLSNVGINISADWSSLMFNYNRFVCTLTEEDKRNLSMFLIGSYYYKMSNHNNLVTLLNITYESKRRISRGLTYEAASFVVLMLSAGSDHELIELRKLFRHIAYGNYGNAKKLINRFRNKLNPKQFYGQEIILN